MISAFFFMGVALAYILLKLNIEKRRAPQHDVCDAQRLSLLAFERQSSTYDLFRAAGQTWAFSNSKITADFNRYLRKGDIPHYVCRYVRSQPVGHVSYQSTLFVGHELPPSTSP